MQLCRSEISAPTKTAQAGVYISSSRTRKRLHKKNPSAPIIIEPLIYACNSVEFKQNFSLSRGFSLSSFHVNIYVFAVIIGYAFSTILAHVGKFLENFPPHKCSINDSIGRFFQTLGAFSGSPKYPKRSKANIKAEQTDYYVKIILNGIHASNLQ